MPLILLILLFAEVALLIRFGQAIGGGLLLIEMAASALLGLLSMRLAKRSFLRTDEFVRILNRPGEALRSSGLSLIIAGLLLILPGILSDAAGIYLVARFFLTRSRAPQPRAEARDPDTIDVEYNVHEDSDT